MEKRVAPASAFFILLILFILSKKFQIPMSKFPPIREIHVSRG